jgi:hypothetical protein
LSGKYCLAAFNKCGPSSWVGAQSSKCCAKVRSFALHEPTTVSEQLDGIREVRDCWPDDYSGPSCNRFDRIRSMKISKASPDDDNVSELIGRAEFANSVEQKSACCRLFIVSS